MFAEVYNFFFTSDNNKAVDYFDSIDIVDSGSGNIASIEETKEAEDKELENSKSRESKLTEDKHNIKDINNFPFQEMAELRSKYTYSLKYLVLARGGSESFFSKDGSEVTNICYSKCLPYKCVEEVNSFVEFHEKRKPHCETLIDTNNNFPEFIEVGGQNLEKYMSLIIEKCLNVETLYNLFIDNNACYMHGLDLINQNYVD